MTNIYEYMQALEIEGVQSCLDALTVTATGLEGHVAIGLIVDSLSEYREGEQPKEFKFGGAVGRQWGSLRVADKYDQKLGRVWSILMMSGIHTATAFKVAASLNGLKFTRCDVATDVFLYEKVLDLPRLIKDNYQGTNKIQLIESDTGSTVAIGSRQSDAYLRVYDKSKEYNLDLGRVYRWEVEYKGGLAPIVVSEVRDGGLLRVRELVFQEAHNKTVPSPIIEGQRGIKRERIAASTVEMKLAWIARQVAPTVKWLKAMGKEREVLMALQLGLSELDNDHTKV